MRITTFCHQKQYKPGSGTTVWKHWKQDMLTQNSILRENICQNWRTKDKISENFYHKQMNTWINVKGSPSGQMKMITDGNLDLHKGMRSTGNWVNIKNFLLCKQFKKINYCLKPNMILWYIVEFITYVEVKYMITQNKSKRRDVRVYYCKVFILYVKWYNTTWSLLRGIKDVYYKP